MSIEDKLRKIIPLPRGSALRCRNLVRGHYPCQWLASPRGYCLQSATPNGAREIEGNWGRVLNI
ncbi:MAG: hypothetical protein DMF24_04820 [Verrucomicrobia bacterium]|nr:MAG: hypothetical protein DME90_08425 [Verrucomicrobiota bacterium]PYL62240.1 MAG: hypothetical protein DMF24_04820 [Verrucomicrobiota bacterium]